MPVFFLVCLDYLIISLLLILIFLKLFRLGAFGIHILILILADIFPVIPDLFLITLLFGFLQLSRIKIYTL